MRLRAVELRRVRLALRTPFVSSSGAEYERDLLLVRASTDVGEGWGECCALSAPLYTSEYVDAAHAVLRSHLLPRLFAAERLEASMVASLLRPVQGHRMAKAAIEMALLDAELRATGVPLASRLGGVRTSVDAGVSLGIAGHLRSLLAEVDRCLSQGYRRVKLKVGPGWDVEPVRAARAAFGPDLPLQVDANSAYTLSDLHHLRALDGFGLLLIEQPLPPDQLLAHAKLAVELETPICLDESIVSAEAAEDAITLGACRVVNVKAARVGGYLEAVRVHDVCAREHVPVWCGGMLETGLGRAGNVALASLPNFTLPGDLSASDRYYEEDLTSPFWLEDGRLAVPTGPGLGVTVDAGRLDRLTTAVERVGC